MEQIRFQKEKGKASAYRVGVRTTAHTPKGSLLIRWRIGRAKASVFPEPVWAIPMQSRPARMAGIQPAWIGVGRRIDIVPIEAMRAGEMPRLEKEEVGLDEDGAVGGGDAAVGERGRAEGTDEEGTAEGLGLGAVTREGSFMREGRAVEVRGADGVSSSSMSGSAPRPWRAKVSKSGSLDSSEASSCSSSESDPCSDPCSDATSSSSPADVYGRSRAEVGAGREVEDEVVLEVGLGWFELSFCFLAGGIARGVSGPRCEVRRQTDGQRRMWLSRGEEERGGKGTRASASTEDVSIHQYAVRSPSLSHTITTTSISQVDNPPNRPPVDHLRRRLSRPSGLLLCFFPRGCSIQSSTLLVPLSPSTLELNTEWRTGSGRGLVARRGRLGGCREVRGARTGHQDSRSRQGRMG
jgi:hypothetical protein